MFTQPVHIVFCHPLAGSTKPGDAPYRPAFRPGGILPVLAVLGLLVLGLPATSSAQALGTMQVVARVVPASAGWAGLAEAKLTVQGIAALHPNQAFVRRGRLVQTSAVVRPSGGHRILSITIQHPHN
jgi:hypothetical protein